MFRKLLDYVETEEEFDNSMLHIKKIYMNENNEHLKLHHIVLIENIVTKLNHAKQFISHLKFKNITTLGFQGDSIAESSFSKTKNKTFGANTSIIINKSRRKFIEFSGRKSRSLEMKDSLQVRRKLCGPYLSVNLY